MLWAAKQAKIISPKLTYRHQLLNAFVATLIASVLGNVLPYGAIIGYMVFMSVMLQSELKTDWGKAILLALAGLVVQILVGILYVFAIYGLVTPYMQT